MSSAVPTTACMILLVGADYVPSAPSAQTVAPRIV
jgi:hypothetical protein